MKDVLYPTKLSLLNKYSLLLTGTVNDLIGLDHPDAGKSGTLSQTVIESPLKSHSENNSEQLGSKILKFVSAT